MSVLLSESNASLYLWPGVRSYLMWIRHGDQFKLSCQLATRSQGLLPVPMLMMFVEQCPGGSQGSSVWLVQLVLHRLCSNEQTLFHPFSLVGCHGCCKLSFLPSYADDKCGCDQAVQHKCSQLWVCCMSPKLQSNAISWITACSTIFETMRRVVAASLEPAAVEWQQALQEVRLVRELHSD